MIAFIIIVSAFLLEHGITKAIDRQTAAIERLEVTIANRSRL